MADTYKLNIKLPTGGEFQGEGAASAIPEPAASDVVSMLGRMEKWHGLVDSA